MAESRKRSSQVHCKRPRRNKFISQIRRANGNFQGNLAAAAARAQGRKSRRNMRVQGPDHQEPSVLHCPHCGHRLALCNCHKCPAARLLGHLGKLSQAHDIPVQGPGPVLRFSSGRKDNCRRRCVWPDSGILALLHADPTYLHRFTAL